MSLVTAVQNLAIQVNAFSFLCSFEAAEVTSAADSEALARLISISHIRLPYALVNWKGFLFGPSYPCAGLRMRDGLLHPELTQPLAALLGWLLPPALCTCRSGLEQHMYHFRRRQAQFLQHVWWRHIKCTISGGQHTLLVLFQRSA